MKNKWTLIASGVTVTGIINNMFRPQKTLKKTKQ